jgi:hypothetical protein
MRGPAAPLRRLAAAAAFLVPLAGAGPSAGQAYIAPGQTAEVWEGELCYTVRNDTAFPAMVPNRNGNLASFGVHAPGAMARWGCVPAPPPPAPPAPPPPPASSTPPGSVPLGGLWFVIGGGQMDEGGNYTEPAVVYIPPGVALPAYFQSATQAYRDQHLRSGYPTGVTNWAYPDGRVPVHVFYGDEVALLAAGADPNDGYRAYLLQPSGDNGSPGSGSSGGQDGNAD